MAVFEYFSANYDLPTQNITHIRSTYHDSNHSITIRINQK